MLSQIIFYKAISPFFLFNAISAEVGVAWECAVANCFLQPYISLLYTVSAEVGVAWECAVANCFLQPYISLLYTVSTEVGVAWRIFHDIIVYIFI